MQAFLLSLVMIFIAELGDKTQLVALCLATRFNARIVLLGITVATLLVHIVSVLLGGGVGHFLSPAWIHLAAGLAFIGFGLWTLHGDEIGDDECDSGKARSPFMLVATTFFLAELGDKTMLTTVTLAASHSLLPVWLGSTIGMVLSDGLAIIVGLLLGKRLPERAIQIGASIIFFGFGIYSTIDGALKLPWYGWGSGSIIVLAMLAWFGMQLRNKSRIVTVQEPEKIPANAE
ncbi:MAG TPA: TMEM165/GDT1 family protein [Armatimonadota bacterium]|nr:TMEM165/GDT1 family protein [Armatimonadota bacterium]